MDSTIAELIASLIGSMGFPIVACCAMGWFINSTFKEFQSLMLENNTLVKTLTEYLMREKENPGEGNESM